MRTDDLIRVLANGLEAADPNLVKKRFALASLAGLASAEVFMERFLGLRANLLEVMGTGEFWLKLSIPIIAMVAILSVTSRLSCPGRSRGQGWMALVLLVAALWFAGVASFALAPSGSKLQMVFGDTWRVCAPCIALLSLPSLVAELWVLRSLAPTRPREAGAAAGLLAGAQGLLVYCFHCPETALPFWAVWYVLGMAVPATIGGVIGKVALRW